MTFDSNCDYCVSMARSEYGIEEPHEAHAQEEDMYPETQTEINAEIDASLRCDRAGGYYRTECPCHECDEAQIEARWYESIDTGGESMTYNEEQEIEEELADLRHEQLMADVIAREESN